MVHHRPSEGSPLLGHDDRNEVEYEGIDNGPTEVVDGECTPNRKDRALNPDEEGHIREEDHVHQYQGIPEVKARLKYILPAVGIGIFLAAADQTIIVSCYGKIGSDLKALENTSWIATAYFITLTSFQPLYGKLSDIFDRKPCLLFAYAIFGLGCLFCGLARTMNELIAARAFAGVGAGGMTTVVSIIMSDTVPLRERGTWQGIINIIYSFGAGCGAPLGGLLADYVSWRWAFLAQAPLCALAFASCALVLNLPKREVADWRSKFRRVDFLGAFVLVAATSVLLFGLDRGANVSWLSPLTIGALCASIPLVITFLSVEFKFAAEPFAPARIIFERSLIACYLCNFFAFAGWIALLFYLPLFYQAVDGLSASEAGVRLLPGIVASVSGSLSSGLVMEKTGKYFWLTVIAYTIATLGILVILLGAGIVVNNTYAISAGLVLGGFGCGIGVTTTLIGLIANAGSEDQAIATACSYLFRSLGSVVGLSVAAAVVQQSLRIQLRNRLKSGKDADTIERGVRQSLDYVKTLTPELQEIVRDCYASSTLNGFTLMLGIVFCAMLCSWFIREKTLSK